MTSAEPRLTSFVDGAFVGDSARLLAVDDPATGRVIRSYRAADVGVVEEAVAAAGRALDGWSRVTLQQRMDWVGRLRAGIEREHDALVEVVMDEVGSPRWLTSAAQVGTAHIDSALRVAPDVLATRRMDGAEIDRIPVGVCALITPWNWPLALVLVKMIPALLAGCTVVVKPSEHAPGAAAVLASIVDAVGLPNGVVNVVHGGRETALLLASHAQVDLVSITGSTAAGVEVALAAAPSIKRVVQELSGNAAGVALDHDGFEATVASLADAATVNSGQNCDAIRTLHVPSHRLDDASSIVEAVLSGLTVGDPREDPDLGPLRTDRQVEQFRRALATARHGGARVIAGGGDRGSDAPLGRFVRPSAVVVDAASPPVGPEVFAPLLRIRPFATTHDVVASIDADPHGLAAHVCGEHDEAADLARRLRVGRVYVNQPDFHPDAPFGGLRASGNGREWGAAGIETMTELRARITTRRGAG